jgi:hypothetical protein
MHWEGKGSGRDEARTFEDVTAVFLPPATTLPVSNLVLTCSYAHGSDGMNH